MPRLSSRSTLLASFLPVAGTPAAARARALAELRHQHDALQHKLDALADIERRLEPSALPASADDAGRR
jgi:hypothetical protein